MISFKQLCECLTINQRHSWFEIPSELEQFITEEEWSICYRDYTSSHFGYLRIFYPKEKWDIEQQRVQKYKEEQKRLKLVEAIEKADSYEDELELLKEQHKYLPSLQTLREQRIAASIKDDVSSVRKIDELITIRCRINAYENSRRVG